ncbi:hypothetical protein H8356DRAFT_1622648 [Neocallimastix lanati (nom. inval.)]|jgi:hypothetical protein|nr:hypothetical protein H8356DRAFT_1622648 [Neocallimastix sp. JGI-2020a]
MPPKEVGYYNGGMKKFMINLLYRIMVKTIFIKLVCNHCKNGKSEIMYINNLFKDYRKNHSGSLMSTWDIMREWIATVNKKKLIL